MAPLLDVREMTHSFGGLTAVQELSFQVREGSITSLIGPNGAGKTTVFNCITGIYRPTRGSITFRGHNLRGLRPHRIARLGLVRTFQNIRLFPNMTALENVLAGRHSRTSAGVLGAIVRPPGQRREERLSAAAAEEMLSFVEIAGRRDVLAAALSYGDQRRLEIARALATQPTLLVLDEPAAGMNPAEKARLSALIQRIRERGVTVLLIDHDMRLVMGVSDHVLVLNYGRKIAEGAPRAVQQDHAVIEAYLGTDEDEDEEEQEASASVDMEQEGSVGVGTGQERGVHVDVSREREGDAGVEMGREREGNAGVDTGWRPNGGVDRDQAREG